MALASLYLDPTPAADLENEGRIVRALAWAKSLGHGCWAIAGDWNRQPQCMKLGLLEQLGAALVAPSEPTCYSSTGTPTCLDWWLVGPDLAARCPSAGTWQETALPTHRPVELRISGKQRPLTLTALRRPAALPPWRATDRGRQGSARSSDTEARCQPQPVPATHAHPQPLSPSGRRQHRPHRSHQQGPDRVGHGL